MGKPKTDLSFWDQRWVNSHFRKHKGVVVDRATGRAICRCGKRRRLRISQR